MPQNNSDLTDRYLNAIKFWLPRAQQRDIIAEIKEDLQSQIEECEAAAGHRLSEDDLVAIVRKRGSPMKVAASYVPEQRLTNPVLLPVYRLVLKIVLLWVLAPLFAIIYIGPLLASAHPATVLLSFWSEAWRTGFMVVGMVTAVFALLDRFHVRFGTLKNWNPRKLPRLPASQQTASRWNHLAGFIFGLVAAVCWIYMWRRVSFSFPGGTQILLVPAWSRIGWPAFVITLASAAIDGFSFLFPAMVRARSVARFAVDAAIFAMASILVRAFPWVEIRASRLSAGEIANLLTWADASIRITLIVIALIALGDIVREVRRLLRVRPDAPAPVLTAF